MVESLLAKVPLISTKNFGAQEVIPDHLTIPIDDIDSLNNALQKYISDPSSFKKSFEEVFDWAEENLKISIMVDRTLEFYDSLLSKKS